ncbi:MAG: hypothetical protein K0S45_4155, partial [Nitrospira sp.]|nr:hypothetical protein [Nitrospira sp.]
MTPLQYSQFFKGIGLTIMATGSDLILHGMGLGQSHRRRADVQAFDGSGPGQCRLYTEGAG